MAEGLKDNWKKVGKDWDGERVDDLDQVHVGDPVGQELSRMRSELKALKTKVDRMESGEK